MIRLGNLPGTKATLTIALISMLDNNRFQLSPAALSKMGLSEESRVDMIVDDQNDGALYIAKVDGKIGRSVSKTGKVQSPQMFSWLTDGKGPEVEYQITDETIDFDGLIWNKLAIFESASTEDNSDDEDKEVAENATIVAPKAEVAKEAEEAPKAKDSDLGVSDTSIF